jgi:hypothetical protein
MFSFIVIPSSQRITKKRVAYSMRKSAKQMRAMPLMMTYYLMHSDLDDDGCNKDEANADSNEEEICRSILYTESHTLDNVCTNPLYSSCSFLLGHSQKKQQLQLVLPVITGLLQSRLHPSDARKIHILFDSGSHGAKNVLIQRFNHSTLHHSK